MNAVLIMASIVHCYVGCNTGSSDKQSLHVLECDTETGAAKIVQSVRDVEGTTYFQIDRDGKFLYSVIGEKRDKKSTPTFQEKRENSGIAGVFSLFLESRASRVPMKGRFLAMAENC